MIGCPYCDDTGDVHGIDGEWRGRCTCEIGSVCEECGGTGLISFKTFPGGIEVDNDDQPCPSCTTTPESN